MCLGIPQSFYNQPPAGYGSHFMEHMAHHQYMMLHKVYQLRRGFTMPPRDEAETQPSQSISAWYGKIKPRVCAPNPSPQALQQQVLYKPSKQKHAKVKDPVSVTHTRDKECHRTLHSDNSYYTKVKALNYLDLTQDSAGHQKVTEKLSTPRVRFQTTRMMQAAQNVHDARCQDVLGAQQYDSMWYRRVGKWLQYIGKAYQNWVHEVDLSYHMLGLRHALIQKGLQRRTEAPCESAYSPRTANRPFTSRKITGRTRSSPDSLMSLPRERRHVTG